MRFFAVVLVLLAAVGAARAQDDCYVSSVIGDIASASLYEVSGEVSRAYFIKNSEDDPRCPSDRRSCQRRAFIVPGDAVLVGPETDGYSCVLYTGGRPNFTATAGWVASDDIFPLGGEDDTSAPDYEGEWNFGQFHLIDIEQNRDGSFHVTGSAAYGAEDPERLARGAVNVGELDFDVEEDNFELAFTVDYDGEVIEYDPEADTCSLRMWRAGPYLVVTDNIRCGGNNVTFTGLYRGD